MAIALCQPCQRMLIYSSQHPSTTKDHHWDFDSIRESIGTGCVLCNYLWLQTQHAVGEGFLQTIVDFESGKIIKSDISRVWTEYISQDNGRSIEMTVKYSASVSAEPATVHSVHLSLRPYARDQTAEAGKRSSEDTTSNIQTWISEFGSRQTTLPMPARLLDLSEYSDVKDNPRIIESSSLAQNEAYATLSHGWNNNQLTQLLSGLSDTVSTINFPFELPDPLVYKKFAHAVDVCKSLNLSYLWIPGMDSLTDKNESVTQDNNPSGLEKPVSRAASTRRNSSRTGVTLVPSNDEDTEKVYRNAAVNITTLGSSYAGVAGLLLSRPQASARPSWGVFMVPTDGKSEASFCTLEPFRGVGERGEVAPVVRFRGLVLKSLRRSGGLKLGTLVSLCFVSGRREFPVSA